MMVTEISPCVVRVVADGPFGAAVADRLVVLLTVTAYEARVAHEPRGEGLLEFLAEGDFGIRVSWRNVQAEFDEFSAAASAASLPWLGVAVAHPYVWVGPAFVPGHGPCRRCYLARIRQHGEVESALNDELDQILSRDGALGVAGYPPHIAAIAAGLAAGMVRLAGGADGQRRVGQIAQINSATDLIQSWRVVTVDGCPECRPITDDDAFAKTRRDRLRALALSRRGDVRASR